MVCFSEIIGRISQDKNDVYWIVTKAQKALNWQETTNYPPDARAVEQAVSKFNARREVHDGWRSSRRLAAIQHPSSPRHCAVGTFGRRFGCLALVVRALGVKKPAEAGFHQCRRLPGDCCATATDEIQLAARDFDGLNLSGFNFGRGYFGNLNLFHDLNLSNINSGQKEKFACFCASIDVVSMIIWY
jgi:hypothetical protein